MTEDEFRAKYPHSTEEQVRLYGEAVALEAAGVKPPVEPDIPMPLITVPQRVVPTVVPETTATTYSVAEGDQYFMRNFSLSDVPPEMPSAATDSAMRDVLLGPFGSHLSPEQRTRFQTTDMSADDMLAAFFDPKWTPSGLGSH
jgi:hypothetical protein